MTYAVIKKKLILPRPKPKQFTNAVAVSSVIPSYATGTVSPNVQTVSAVRAVNFTGPQRNTELENAYQKA